MLDGEETVEIASGELRWEGARQHAGRIGNGANSLRRASLEGSDADAGGTGNRGNGLRGASLGGSDRAGWTETKPWKSLAQSYAGRERDSMLDRYETVEIAFGELRWEGARQHAGRRGNRANSLRKASLGRSETACWTERKPCK